MAAGPPTTIRNAIAMIVFFMLPIQSFSSPRFPRIAADRDVHHRNSLLHDSAFAEVLHLSLQQIPGAKGSRDRRGICRLRRGYRARSPADTARRPCPADP